MQTYQDWLLRVPNDKNEMIQILPMFSRSYYECRWKSFKQSQDILHLFTTKDEGAVIIICTSAGFTC
jgi:hypothetical protein